MVDQENTAIERKGLPFRERVLEIQGAKISAEYFRKEGARGTNHGKTVSCVQFK